MKNKERIQLEDSTSTIIVKMSDGNFGAMNALTAILKDGPKVDPDDGLLGMGAILMLDTWGIYGTDIYVLHSDICNKNISKTIAIIRAAQLGILDSAILKDACSRHDYSGRDMINVDVLCEKVKERLPNFNLS